MTPEKLNRFSKICPVCGTKLSDNATRCLVCGTPLTTTAGARKASGIQPRRPAEVRLNLPVAIILGILMLALIGLLIYFILDRSNKPSDVTLALLTETPTATATITQTPTITPTSTPEPTWTPLPPIEVKVRANEYCSTFAGLYNVSILSIIRQNNLDANCTISEGMTLFIPQPTLTASPMPTATPDLTQVASLPQNDCDKTITVEIGPTDTLSSIAMNYNVSITLIKEYNRMTSDIVRQGDNIVVPLCERLPTAGPSPTPTDPPPYPAPNLLLPNSGTAFTSTADSVTLQWAAVADLRPNELYRVTIQDLTSDVERILVEYVRDTKFIIPVTFRPYDTTCHIIQWTVAVARQTNPGDPNPIYIEAGNAAQPRVFSWVGTGTAPTQDTTTPIP